MSKVPFTASTTRRGNVNILAIAGEIDLYVDAKMGAALDEAVRSATSPLIVDLRDVRYMDSSGFRRLVRASEAVTAQGDYFAVVVSAGIVARLLEILQVRAVMPIHNDLEAALVAAEAAYEPPNSAPHISQ